MTQYSEFQHAGFHDFRAHIPEKFPILRLKKQQPLEGFQTKFWSVLVNKLKELISGTRRRRPNEAHNQSSGSNNIVPISLRKNCKFQNFSSNEWTFAFDRVITDDEGRNEFTKFLQSEYSEENILFWWAVQELRLCVEDRTAFERMVREMFETFIATDSPLAINIDHDTRTEIIERVQLMDAASVPNTIFDKAQSQIYRLMEKDCFSRFVHTQAYKDLARRLSLPHTFRFNERLSPF
ncbi:unnamed protein product [Anisakis simplex]|uniref:RGS domain-containing protein n=1 Tax=Anisakis simplex TaxID=6269 RepID=A0A0M3J0H9_ANISI|nr:unnamed protein product [Anisakis simplex]